MDVYDQLRQRNDLETELFHQKNLVVTLQSKIEALQGEVRQSRQDVIGAERIVNELSQQVTNQEADLHQRTIDFEAQLKAKGLF
jgi:peptidoglycan hydrolase CwlO-like protein